MKAVNQRKTENYAPNYKALLKDIKENFKNNGRKKKIHTKKAISLLQSKTGVLLRKEGK